MKPHRLLIAIYIALALTGVLIPGQVFFGRALTKHEAAHALDAEKKTVGEAIKQLGFEPTEYRSQCFTMEENGLASKDICDSFAYSSYDSNPIGAKRFETYKKNVPHMLDALKNNGWVYDNQTEYDNSEDKLIDVAYHKNIGPISCNFKIYKSNYTGINSAYNSESTYNLNEFSCSKRVNLLNFPLRHRYVGA